MGTFNVIKCGMNAQSPKNNLEVSTRKAYREALVAIVAEKLASACIGEEYIALLNFELETTKQGNLQFSVKKPAEMPQGYTQLTATELMDYVEFIGFKPVRMVGGFSANVPGNKNHLGITGKDVFSIADRLGVGEWAMKAASEAAEHGVDPSKALKTFGRR